MKIIKINLLFFVMVALSLYFSINVRAASSDDLEWNCLSSAACSDGSQYELIKSTNVRWNIFVLHSGSSYMYLYVTPDKTSTVYFREKAGGMNYYNVDYSTNGYSGLSPYSYNGINFYFLGYNAYSYSNGLSFSCPVFHSTQSNFNLAVQNMISSWVDGSLDHWDIPEPEVPAIDDFLFSRDLGVLLGLDNSRGYTLKNSDGTFRQVGNRFVWDNTTSSGINIYNNDYDSLQVQYTIRGFRYAVDELKNKTLEASQFYYSEPIDIQLQTLDISLTDCKKYLPDIYNYSSAITRDGIVYQYPTSYYFRILGEKDGEYYRGSWVKVDFKDAGNDELLTSVVAGGESSAEDFSVDSSSPYGDITIKVNSEIHGYTENDVTHTIQKVEGVSGVIESLEDLMTQIGYIPQIIAVVFSWLPAWCLGLCASSFGLMIVLIVYKLARG